MKRFIVVLLVGLVASCSGGGDEQVAALTVARDDLIDQVSEAEAEALRLADQVEVLEAELETARSEASQARSAVEEADNRVSDAEARAAEAGAEAEELRLRFDPEIRAELQAAYDAEVVRACADSEERWQTPVSSIVRWDPDWSPVATQAALISAVEDCSADERSKTLAQRETERLASCVRIDVDAVEKDPDAFTGVCVHMYVEIIQFDANTGRCSFRGEMSAVRSTSWLDYDGNAIFLTASDSLCPELDGIDNNDFVEVWATGAGSLTYDTTIGGSATAIVWEIDKIELVRKA